MTLLFHSPFARAPRPMELNELLAPIPGSDPGGPSLRAEMVYREIELARVDGLSRFAAGERGEPFERMANMAAELLARRSKDLQVAAWLVEAWTYQGGLSGLRRGLELLRELLDRYWDHVHPVLEDGDPDLRVTSLEWLDRALPAAVQVAPLTRAGHGVRAYHEARRVGHKPSAGAESPVLRDWEMAMTAGLVSAEMFDPGLASTLPDWLAARLAEVGPARAAAEALHRVCEARFGDLSPRFTALRDALDEYERVATTLLESRRAAASALSAEGEGGDPAPVLAARELAVERSPAPVENARDQAAGPPPAPVAAPSRPAAVEPASIDKEAAVASGDAPSAPAEGAEPPRSWGEAGGRMAALARWLRERAPADPAPYLMVRGFRWGELRAAGPAPDPRLLAAPPTQRRVWLKTLLLEERWAELLEAAEELMATEYGRGWLDLQRYVATACEALGPEYDAARQAVAGALRALLHDLPALPGMALMDDTPVANAETLAWLREAGIAPDAASAEAPHAPPRGAGPRERARARAAAGEPERAVEILLDAASREHSSRSRFLLRAQAAEVMVEAGLEAVAVPLLRDLAEQVERHGLEGWEAGDMVAHPLALLCRCMDLVGDHGSERGALYLRVCKLDPLRAIPLRGAGHAAA